MGIGTRVRGLLGGEDDEPTVPEVELHIEVTNVNREDAERLERIKDDLDATAVTLTGTTTDGEPAAVTIKTEEAEAWQSSPLYHTAPEPDPDADDDAAGGDN